MSTLHEKIALLSPSLLPMVEQFIDTLPPTAVEGYDWRNYDPHWGPPPVDENGKRIHPKAGCMKGTFVMHDNFFEPDEDWEEYM